MKINMKFFVIFLVALALGGVRGECDQCNANNPVACHNETTYSLCYNSQPTMDFVTCPTDYICTDEPFVCRPKALAVPSCNNTNVIPTSQCGLCLSKGKVFACLNETTIAFCFGDETPHYGSLSYCPEGTVCDLNSGSKFCAAATNTTPSCRESEWGTTTTTTISTSTTATPTTSSTPTTTTITTQTPTTSSTTTTATTAPSTTTPTLTTTSTSTTTAVTTTTPTTTTTTTTPTPTTTSSSKTTTTPTPTTTSTSTTTAPTTTTPTTTTTTTTTTPPTTTTTTPTSTTTSTSTTAPTTTTAITTTTTPTPTTTPTTTTLSTTTTSPSTTSSTTTTEHNLTPKEICEQTNKTGSIVNADDLTCRTFFICLYVNGVWSGQLSTCPSNQRFDPTLRICSAAYTCSIDNSTTSLTTTTTTTTPTTTMTTTTPTTTTSTTTTSTTTAATTTESPAQLCENNGKTGIIAMPNDTTCKKYIYCSKPSTKWIAQQRECKVYFDPVAKACSDTCPSTCNTCT